MTFPMNNGAFENRGHVRSLLGSSNRYTVMFNHSFGGFGNLSIIGYPASIYVYYLV